MASGSEETAQSTADMPGGMANTRLIERWLPIVEIGIESTRERRSMTALPPTYYLHVWWARRPLVASRAAVLASLLPANANRKRFLHVLGIHGDPVAAQRRIDAAKRKGEHLGPNPYGYPRAFTHSPDTESEEWIERITGRKVRNFFVLDPTAGGGSIPIETERLGFRSIANDLNPVSALILRATVEWPKKFGSALIEEFDQLSHEFIRRAKPKYSHIFPEEPENVRIEGYLWARTVFCPGCDGLVPLSPNWRLAKDGTGVRLHPHLGNGPGSSGRVCSFEIVETSAEQSARTVLHGAGSCPWPDCRRVIDGDEIKRQAQEGDVGEQMFAVAFKKRVIVKTKTGKSREKWVRGYRAPRPGDDNRAAIARRFAEKMPEWEALSIVPGEKFPPDSNDDRPIQYGMPLWRDLFSPRQLLCHGASVEIFQEMLEADRKAGALSDLRKAAYGYLALMLDTLLSYNSRLACWDNTTGRVRSTFVRHDFAFVWSYAEMAPCITGLGYEWAINKTAKCIGELVALVRPEGEGMFKAGEAPGVTITCKPGDSLDHIADRSIDAVVVDPPYYDNVMYAELSDFFYVWLKRTAGHVFPELFRRHLTDKDNEAVANPALFRGEKGAQALAKRRYQARMASIFAECRRVLKPDGIMTLMFTHKATGAWDAVAKGVMEAGFVIIASWPVNTEAPGSLHIRNKAAAKSTVFLACRPRADRSPSEESIYWEDVEPRVARAVRKRVAEFQEAGIKGVDLYLACFGPALEEFSRHWPLRRGTPREAETPFDEEWDPYAATPEDALDAARREVKRWRLEQLTRLQAGSDIDPATAFFVMAWDTFRAPVFAYDEALQLARAIGVDLDREVVGWLAEKKGSDVRLWDSARRAAKGALGPPDGSRGMIDALHHAASMARTRNLGAARELLEGELGEHDSAFLAALEAVLEVLPVSARFTGVELEGETAAAADDFEALYHLSRLAFDDAIDEPEQLKLWRDGEI